MNDSASEHDIDGATISGPNTAEGTHRPTPSVVLPKQKQT